MLMPSAIRPRRTFLRDLCALALVNTPLLRIAHAQQPARHWTETADTRRLALVIGNAAYQHGPRLKNPTNDADAITASLRQLGFDVTEVKDGTKQQMIEAIGSFGDKLTTNCVALVYYSGHGMQVDGENYLLPVDFDAKKRVEVEFEGVPARRILAQFADRKSPVNILILDACRDNPFRSFSRSDESGLVEMKAPHGTLIAYATSPGSTADDNSDSDNGLYTTQLLKELPTPGITVEQMFKQVRQGVAAASNAIQVPWDESSILGDLYLVAGHGTILNTHARLQITVNAPNPTITIDGRLLPPGTDYVTNLVGIDKRTVKLAVTAPGYDGQELEVELHKGVNSPLSVNLVALLLPVSPVAAAVITAAHPVSDLRLLLTTLKGHTDIVEAVCFSPDEKYIVTGSDDNTAIVWDATTGERVHTLVGHAGRVYTTSFAPNSSYIATGSTDKTVIVWDATNGQQLRILSGHTDGVYAASFSPNSKYIVAGSEDATAIVWDATTGNKMQTLSGHVSPVRAASFSPDGKYILTGSSGGTVIVWDVATGEEIHTFKGVVAERAESFSPDGKYIVTGSTDNIAIVWDATTGKQVRTLTGHNRSITAASFSPDGKYIVTGSEDTTAIVWNATTGKKMQTLRGHILGISSTSFSPDSKYIVTGSADHTAKVWDAATGKSAE